MKKLPLSDYQNEAVCGVIKRVVTYYIIYAVPLAAAGGILMLILGRVLGRAPILARCLAGSLVLALSLAPSFQISQHHGTVVFPAVLTLFLGAGDVASRLLWGFLPILVMWGALFCTAWLRARRGSGGPVSRLRIPRK